MNTSLSYINTLLILDFMSKLVYVLLRCGLGFQCKETEFDVMPNSIASSWRKLSNDIKLF